MGGLERQDSSIITNMYGPWGTCFKDEGFWLFSSLLASLAEGGRVYSSSSRRRCVLSKLLIVFLEAESADRFGVLALVRSFFVGRGLRMRRRFMYVGLQGPM